jgi:hypothetical protein
VRFLCCFLLAGVLCAETPIFPLKDVRPGMKGIGKTVFSGNRIDEFQVQVLGVLENIGPKQSIILAKLSGGPLAQTGVLQGMSGSPVYIDGKLVGAVAMGFGFSKEPIAGIRPIEEMLHITESPAPARRASAALWDGRLDKLVPPSEDVLAPGGARMIDIATPVSFGGFTRAAIEHFAPQLRSLGLEPMQGAGGGGNPGQALGNPTALQPGSMISVQLLSGDMSIGADGTVTYIDKGRVYAFGHRFLSIGATDLPFARAEVLTLLPNLSSSFKISTAREWMGSITQDRSTAIAGQVGRTAATVPVSISVRRHGAVGKPDSYQMRMVNDRVLSPFLLQMAVFSAIDATERAVGDSSFSVTGELEFEKGSVPLKIDNMYAGDMNLASQVSMAAAVPLAYAMQSGFDSLQLKRVALEIGSFPEKRELQIDQVWASKREVRPGESVDITVLLAGENGAEVTRSVTYRVPVGAPTGLLQFSAADATTINLTEYRQMISAPPKSAAQLVSFMNGLRRNTRAYLRVWRAEPSYDVAGESLPGPPPSLGMILARSQSSLSGMPAFANSKVAEFEINAGDVVVSGSKTIQVEVKE